MHPCALQEVGLTACEELEVVVGVVRVSVVVEVVVVVVVIAGTVYMKKPDSK